jgi:hypothetical protein
MHKTFNPFQQPSNVNLLNNNALMARPLNTGKSQSKTSFANELAAMQSSFNTPENPMPEELNQQEQFLDANDFKPNAHRGSKQNLGIMEASSEEISEKLKIKLKEMRDKEEVFEQVRNNNFEESTRLAEEIADKYNKSETTMAAAAQENNKTVTEAYKEGNVAQEQAQHYDSNDRKKQLAKWDELAPRIIEDPKNRAVRIDIPGLNDVETLIVRMKQDSVHVQVVGEKSVMERLQLSESELGRKLREHNVKLASLQAFDSASIGKGANK